MATNNEVGVGLSGATGTGSFVGSTSPSLTTPTLGAATATSVTFNPSTGGPVGTTASNNASAGIVGQIISAAITTPVSLSTGNPADLTSITLTAGDWDVYGNVSFTTTTATNVSAWISLTSATLPDASLYNSLSNTAAMTNIGISVPFFRASVSGNTSVFISAQATFATSTCTMIGTIFARRAR